MIYSYLSPKTQAMPNPAKGGHGIFATAFIPAGDLILVWGGKIHTYDEYLQAPPQRQPHFIQVEEGLYLGGADEQPEPADFLNHSCDPTAGMRGQIALIALRDIQPGEEICIDYAMCDGSPYDEFTCACGSANCRGRVTGNDWQNPQLQKRYAGYFSPYLQTRIDRLSGKTD